MVNFLILLMPFTFLYIATYFFFLLLLFKGTFRLQKLYVKNHWHKPAYCPLFSLWQDDTKVFFYNQTRKCEWSLQNRQTYMYLYTESICFQGASSSDERIPFASLHLVSRVATAVLFHWCFSTLTYSSFFINFRWLLLLSLFSASFAAIYGVGRLVCSLETYFVNPGTTPFVYLRKQLGSHCFSCQPIVRFSFPIKMSQTPDKIGARDR